MRRNKTLGRVAALLLSVLLLLGVAAPALAAVEPTGSVITIDSADDLLSLSQSCSLDTWSQGKTVLLTSDISLDGVDFQPIPTFGGTFDGGGHTISGLAVSGSLAPAGLFGIVQSEGVVKDLTVSGTVDPSGDGVNVGGIVGINHGRLTGCSFRGYVGGTSTVGGVAGLNEAAGQLVRCTFQGAVTGEHYVGGIAGWNVGSLVRCDNWGSVNTTEVDVDASLSDLDLSSFYSTENLPASTDVGGVAGFSTGILQSCQNHGDVGYEHMGYNVGGVVGRQSGYLDGCVNTGTIRGRKDVGGIVGQMEPQVTLKYNENSLSKLWDELDVLEELMDKALRDAETVSHDLSGTMDGLTTTVTSAKEATSDLTDAMAGWADENIGQINDFSARISWVMDQMDPVLDDVGDGMDRLEEALGLLEPALDELKTAGNLGNDVIHDLNLAIDDMEAAADAGGLAFDHLEKAMEYLEQALGGSDDTEPAWQELRSAADSLQDSAQALDRALGHLSDAAKGLEEVTTQTSAAAELLKAAAAPRGEAAELLHKAGDATKDTLQDLADMPAIQFTPVGGAVTEKGETLDGALTLVLDSVSSLNDVMTLSSDALLADLRAINAQAGVIIDVLRQETEQAEDEESGEHFEDISDQELFADGSSGRVSSARNGGAVEGDVNVAGIVGAMAIEYDFDPEDDLTESGGRSLDFRYQAAAVVTRSVNEGTVTAKKDCAGGIVGRMDLGTVHASEGYGRVESTSGDYVGGVAGQSSATIRDSFAKCVLSGGRYVGGILGGGDENSVTRNCYSLVRIEAFGQYAGAISGDETGTFTGNGFVSDVLSGLDRVSYAGQAEPMAYDDLLQVEGLPTAFQSFTLTFVVEDTVLKAERFHYGDSFDEAAVPAIPAEEGNYAQWDVTDLTDLRFDTVVTAVYTPYITALSSPAAREDGRAVFYVEGLFQAGDNMEVQSLTGNGEPFRGIPAAAFQDRELVELWHLSFSDDGQDAHTLRFLLPEGDHLRLYVKNGETWERVKGEAIGRYLALDLEGNDAELAVFSMTLARWVWVVLILAALLLAVLLAWRWSARRRRKKAAVNSV